MNLQHNSQEQNESIDQLHPEYPEKYVLVNSDNGSVQWCECYDTAVRLQSSYGGTIINTATADPDLVKLTLDNARRNM